MAQSFSRATYNLVGIRPGDEWKKTFRTRYGYFEYTIMPFGLTNAPTLFQHMPNDIVRDLLDICLIIYLNNLLVYSKTQEEHDSHILLLLKRLWEHGLYAKLEKCSFDCNQVEFLGYLISSEGISMDPVKVQSVSNSTFIAICAMLFGICKFLSQVYTGLLKAYFTAHTAYTEGTTVCLV